jgi:hypothetical protein
MKGTAALESEQMPFKAVCELMGFPAVWEFDRAHAE